LESLQLRLTCRKCETECRVTIPEGADTGGFRCPACGEHLLQFEVMKGYVYVLSNPRMPGLLKIGSTTRRVEERVEELNSATGVPTRFTVEAYFPSRSPEAHEFEVHKRLETKRIKGREFFEEGLGEVIETTKSVVGAEPIFLNHAAKRLIAQKAAQAVNINARWACGLCKHEWIGSLKSDSPHFPLCPLCRSNSVVCLGRDSSKS